MLRTTLATLALLALVSCTPAERPDSNENREAEPSPAAAAAYVDITKEMPYDFVAVDFISVSRGWIVGNDAENNVSVVARTTDGGATWSRTAEIVGETLLDVAFADEENGWAVGVEGIVYRTTDSGRTWAPEPDSDWTTVHTHEPVRIPSKTNADTPLITNESIASIVFTDARTGWAAGDTPTGEGVNLRGLVLGTTDGGKTWTELTSASGAAIPSLDDVWFVDANNGWAVGGTIDDRQEDVLLHTTDGGRTWQSVKTGTAQYLRGVHFVDAQHGWVVGMTIDAVDESQGPSKILATEDGGKTWAVQFTAPRSFYDVTFASAERGWAVGDRATVYATTDGGKSWRQQTRFDVRGGAVVKAPASNPRGPRRRAFRTVFVRSGASAWIGGEGVILERSLSPPAVRR